MLDRELDDAVTLVELGEMEDDAATEKEGVEAMKALLRQARQRQIEALFSGEADGNDTYIEVHSGAAAPRARTGRACCSACTPAGRSARSSRSR